MAFADDLKKWRGTMLQKEAADALQVSIDTYRAWEQNKCQPSEKPPKSEIIRRMKEHKP